MGSVPAGPPNDSRTFWGFGRSWKLRFGGDEFLLNDSLWRSGAIYEPFLATHPVPRTGVLVDIGAGFGALAVPFAGTHPDWEVWAFEPVPEYFDALQENVARLGLRNVHPVNAAVVPRVDSEAGVSFGDGAPTAKFLRSLDKPGFICARGVGDVPADMAEVTLPVVSADEVARLEPTLCKVVAPGHEGGILDRLARTSVSMIMGEAWGFIPSSAVYRSANPRLAVRIPVAGSSLALSREPVPGRRAGLDVVVAAYNATGFVEECVRGIVDNDAVDIRALVVDDGSTDDTGAEVQRVFGDNPRVVVLRKENGGAASARNYGRMMSDATHVAFVDADDRVDAQLFPDLLELARYTGAEVVQGGFGTFIDGEDDQVLSPSYEVETLSGLRRNPFFGHEYFVAGSEQLVPGQPTIWRRVYREDFLTNRRIWFPEHIRAFDDQIFHMLSLHYAGTVPCMDHVNYHYRQHPAQDIRSGDERFFYSFEMYRTLFKRAYSEGWADFGPYLRSYVNTVNWSYANLRDDLREPFAQGAAELWLFIRLALGEERMRAAPVEAFDVPDFARRVDSRARRLLGASRGRRLATLRGTHNPVAELGRLEGGTAWTYLDSGTMHVPFVRARKTW